MGEGRGNPEARTLVLCAHLDTVGIEGAQSEVSEIKAAVPQMACDVIDLAIQLHGGIGVTDEYPIGHYAARLTAIEYTLGSSQDQLHVLIGQLGDYEVVTI